MRAAYLVEPGKIDICDRPQPTPSPGEVVLRVQCALTCGTDLKAFRRGHPFIPMPGPFGHQYAGTIAAVGGDVQGFEPDMPVWGANSAPCGQCGPCRRGRPNLCERLEGELLLGAFAEYLRIPVRVVQRNLLRRADGIPARRAAFLEPVSCVVHGLRILDWTEVDRVLVLGLGAMGQLFLQLLPEFTGAAVVAAGRHADRLALARSYGPAQVLDVDDGPLWELLDDADGFDCVIECTGKAAGWKGAFDAVRPGGQVELFGGLPRGSVFEVDTYRLHYQEIRLLGSFHFDPHDVRAAADILQGDQVQVDGLITGELPLEQLGHALERMAAGVGIKYAIDPWATGDGIEAAAAQEADLA